MSGSCLRVVGRTLWDRGWRLDGQERSEEGARPTCEEEVGNCTFSKGPSTACDYRLCPTSSWGPPPHSAAGFPSRPRGTRPRNRASSGGSALTRISSVHSPADCLEVSDRTVPTAALPGSLCRLSGLRIGEQGGEAGLRLWAGGPGHLDPGRALTRAAGGTGRGRGRRGDPTRGSSTASGPKRDALVWTPLA